MVMVLPEWNGKVVGVMHRMGMTVQALAIQMGVQRTYASKLLNTGNHTQRTRSRVEDALRSFARERGIEFEELWPAEKGSAESADTGTAESAQMDRSVYGLNYRGEPKYLVIHDKPPAYR